MSKRKMPQHSKRMPTGYVRSGKVKVAISFPKEMFEQIKAMALHDDKKFSDMVSELCRVGLFDLSESDRLEPQNEERAH